MKKPEEILKPLDKLSLGLARRLTELEVTQLDIIKDLKNLREFIRTHKSD